MKHYPAAAPASWIHSNSKVKITILTNKDNTQIHHIGIGWSSFVEIV